MRQGAYLNFILTINAVLLAALVWTQLASPDAPAPSAAVADVAQGIPNAGAQRADIVRSLRTLNQTVGTMAGRIESGGLEVRVQNLDEIDIEITP